MWNRLVNLFRPKGRQSYENNDQDVLVWAVLDGPIQDGLSVWTLIVKVSIEGELIITELHFSNFEDANNFSNLVMTSEKAINLSIPSDLDIAESERVCQKQQ